MDLIATSGTKNLSITRILMDNESIDLDLSYCTGVERLETKSVVQESFSEQDSISTVQRSIKKPVLLTDCSQRCELSVLSGR